MIFLRSFGRKLRALDGGERRHRETIIKSVENIRDVQDTSQQQKQGFSLLRNPFKRNNPPMRQYTMHGGAN